MSAAVDVAALAAAGLAALAPGATGPGRLGGRPRLAYTVPDVRIILGDRRTALFGAAGLGLVLASTAGVVPALAVALVVRAVLVAIRDGVVTARVDRREAGWQAALRAIAGTLLAGALLPTALRRGASASSCPPVAAVLGAVAATAEMGGDPLTALRERCSSGPGAQLAAVLELAANVGAPPAMLATGLADTLTAQARAHRAGAVAIAGARATTRMLAALPLAGIALAGAFGASAPTFLLGTRPGHACLLVAACFEAAGLAWTRRLLAGLSR